MTSLHDYLDIMRLLAPSLATAQAIGIGGSLVGTFVLLRREALTALAMPQVVAVGAAAALRLDWPTLPPALACVALAVVLLATSKRRGSHYWMLPALYIAGLSLSFLIIANGGAHVIEMQNLFTGIDVAVTPTEAALAVPVLLIVGLACALLWRRWLLIAQAPAVAELAGIHPGRWDALFLCLLATLLLIGTDALGAVMVVAMLFLPAGTVLPWFRRIPEVLATSVALSALFLGVGFVFSVEMNWPLSQSVGGVGFGCMLVSHVAAVVKPR